jgi:ribose 1,5-bisphosphate isomerase
MKKEARINSIIKDIKTIKIQGARSIAKAALHAYSLLPTKKTKQKLIEARPTEPLLVNTLHKFEKIGKKKTLEHFDVAQKKINLLVLKLIKSGQVIFTHCHSTNVINALVYAKKRSKKFEVYNTETRPLYQGRKTARELKKRGIKVTTFVDAAARIALTGSQGTRDVDMVFFGADAILKDGVINKVGSGMFAQIAYDNKIPVYIIADSWKYTKHVKLEERSFKEIWKSVPRNIKIRNPAFEKVPKKYIKAIVSELGILTLPKFIKKAKN